MVSYAEALAALPSFRNFVNELQVSQQHELVHGEMAPVSGLHATGVGLRRTKAGYDPDQIVLKLFMFQAPDEPSTWRPWEGVPVDIDELPVQSVWLPQSVGVPPSGSPVTPVPQRQRHRPLHGGISVSPVGATYAGTAGIFLSRRRSSGQPEVLLLSNRHVLVGPGRYFHGVQVAQPAEYEQGVTGVSNVIGTVSAEIPLLFTAQPTSPVTNQYDAAVATVADPTGVEKGVICGGLSYTSGTVGVPVPGMRVIKCGRTTGVTRGMVIAVGVGPLRVNYGSIAKPQITTFEDTIEIVSTSGGPFSLPGDSGSVVIDEASGTPVALIFCGDTVRSSACELGPICRTFQALPV